MAAQQTPTFVLRGLGPHQATPALSVCSAGNHQLVTSTPLNRYREASVRSLYTNVTAPATLPGISSEDEWSRYTVDAVSCTGTSTCRGKPGFVETATTPLRWFFSGLITLNSTP